ncbi:hypothetical protein F5880DRAFT_1612563 [Lentinula raphanica]|nr:hypothetical protein F5880DRAFT_1612563 [Lentinula raphanica]
MFLATMFNKSECWDGLAMLFDLVPQGIVRREHLSALNIEEERSLANDTNAFRGSVEHLSTQTVEGIRGFEATGAALDYITSHILSHSLSLKIQTSMGDYLSNFNVWIEDFDLTNDRSMDDLIPKAAIQHDEHGRIIPPYYRQQFPPTQLPMTPLVVWLL